MKAYIYKYTNDLINNETPNFFMDGFEDNFVDKIVLIDSIIDFPEFTDEWNSQDDFMEWKVGNFDLLLSPLFGEKSINSDTLEEFFFGNVKDFRYLCIVEPIEPNVYADFYCRRAGFIEPNTIDFDKTVTKNKWQISFTVIGMLRELADRFITDDITGDAFNTHPNNIDMMDFIYYPGDRDHSLLGGASLGTFGFKDNLNLKAKLGWDHNPILSTMIYDDLFNTHSAENSGNMNRWIIFKEIAKGFGFIYRLVCTEVLDELAHCPHFELNLLWRSSGVKNVDIEIITEEKDVISNIYANRWIYQASHQEIWTFGPTHRTLGTGWVSNGTQEYNAEKPIGSINETNIFRLAESSERYGYSGTDLTINWDSGRYTIHWNYIFSFKEILYISSALEGIFNLGGSTTITRCFVKSWSWDPLHQGYSDEGAAEIKALCPLTEYRFLCSGAKIIRKLKIFLDGIFELSLFCTSSSLGDEKTYWCQRIDNINYLKQTADVEFVEV